MHPNVHSNIIYSCQYTCAKSLQSCLSLCDPMDSSPPGSSVHGDSPGKNTRVDCHALLQGIFLMQGWNPDLPHCRRILYHLIYQRSPRILKGVAYPFSRGTSWPKDRTRVSCIAGGFFELPEKPILYYWRVSVVGKNHMELTATFSRRITG